MTGSTGENILLIFAKNPERGRVKTRLAESVGEEKALEIYQQLLKITKSITDKLTCNRQVWYSDFIEDEDIWSTGDYEKKLQKGSDLGERMKKAFRQAFASSYEKVIIIGSDCAALTPEIINQGFDLLEKKEVVIGPSQDGGYYLLGMREFHPRLFDDMTWSTASVYENTLTRIRELGLKYENLPELNDIDTELDLVRSDEL